MFIPVDSWFSDSRCGDSSIRDGALCAQLVPREQLLEAAIEIQRQRPGCQSKHENGQCVAEWIARCPDDIGSGWAGHGWIGGAGGIEIGAALCGLGRVGALSSATTLISYRVNQTSAATTSERAASQNMGFLPNG